MIESLASADRNLFLLINGWHSPLLNPFMVFFSSQIIWLPFIALVLLLAFRQLEKKSFFIFVFFLILAIVASDVTSSYLIKNLVQRLRPCRVPEIKELIYSFGQKCGGRFGFVSSHASNSICIVMFSFLALKLKLPKFHLLWILPLIVCYSRIYLGVHYPGDILGGLLIGIFWSSVFAWFFRSHESWGKSA